MTTAAPLPEVRAYLDHASSSPLRPEVIEALGEVLALPQADPGRPYEEAIAIRRLIEDARASVASLASVTSRQVIFTSSIAESANHAISALSRHGTVLATGAERTSVLEAAGRSGELELVDLDTEGHLASGRVAERLEERQISLLCLQLANHETGVLTEVGPLVELAHRHGTAVHLDASTAFGHLEVDLGALGADAVTISSELLGGPQGVGALVIRRGSLLAPLLVGGAQERARRAGLENVLGIIGFGVAAQVLAEDGVLLEESRRAMAAIADLEAAALAVEGVAAVGDPDPRGRVPHVRCFTVEGVEAEPILMGLDRAGISVHSGSACSAESLEPSAVLAAMGLDADRSLRLSVGWSTVEHDVARFASSFGDVVAALRRLRT